MKKHLNKIILNLFLIMLVTACHTLEHNGFKLKPTNKNIVEMDVESKNINSKNTGKASEKIITEKKIKEKVTKKLEKPAKLLPIQKLNQKNLIQFQC